VGEVLKFATTSQVDQLWRPCTVEALKIKNVRVSFDSGMDNFLWRPYVKYADNCGMFYSNDEILVPFKNNLDENMLSFVICLRVSELVGFESIEQYLPHRVAMQFGMDQDVPDCVSRFNETKIIARKNYCRPLFDTSNIFWFYSYTFDYYALKNSGSICSVAPSCTSKTKHSNSFDICG
jgi:hypothetical protein